jgi:hypothetical protein
VRDHIVCPHKATCKISPVCLWIFLHRLGSKRPGPASKHPFQHLVGSVCLTLDLRVCNYIFSAQKRVPGIFLGEGEGRPARKADNLTAICEPIV